ncbi:DNA replication complex GINS protein PSF1-like protein [Euroglyphus maynei]|uniref:DNA replication complex GINS protein PSF1 n=1 Tax=Euroglyphus maynei TaxID=6958 RepID=A0A1Y3AQ11_EURMA|nr:DNA replication complex GINS protein PSF1-like protein [Euroglyphus maynei]
MFGEKCVDLIKESTRDSSELIAPYNQTLVNEVFDEMRLISHTLFESLSSDSEQVPTETAEQQSNYDSQNRLLVNKVYLRAFLWNKRCLLAYHCSIVENHRFDFSPGSHHRLERLKRIRWQLGAILPAEVKCNLSEDEIKWFAAYSRNLSDYMNRLNDNKGIDLTLMRNPPKKLYVQVRCISDYGPLELDDGHTVVLSKDSMHNLPLSKCEKLIHQGVLEQIL